MDMRPWPSSARPRKHPSKHAPAAGRLLSSGSGTLLTLAAHLPAEASEALLELATGGKPKVPQKLATGANPFDHPDAQRRFRIVGNAAELQRALDYPWDRWTVFLHPEQRQWIERDFNGPAKVAGSAGTGKTVVALHRAAFLARRHPEARVLLATFSEPLANALRINLHRLVSDDPRLAERIEVGSLQTVGTRLYRSLIGQPKLAKSSQVDDLVRQAAGQVTGHKFGHAFLIKEWDHTVDSWQLKSWEEYREAPRLGRKTRLSDAQRQAAWSIFERVRAALDSRGLITISQMFTDSADTLRKAGQRPFDFTVVDEAHR